MKSKSAEEAIAEYKEKHEKYFTIEELACFAQGFNSGLDFAAQSKWVDALYQTPELIKDKDYSKNVLAIINGQLGVACYCFHYEEDGENNGYYWANCYGNIDGDCEWDDDYEVTHWQPLPSLPTPPTP